MRCGVLWLTLLPSFGQARVKREAPQQKRPSLPYPCTSTSTCHVPCHVLVLVLVLVLGLGAASVASGQREVEVGGPREGREPGEIGPKQPAKVDECAGDADGPELVRRAPQPTVHGLRTGEIGLDTWGCSLGAWHMGGCRHGVAAWVRKSSSELSIWNFARLAGFLGDAALSRSCMSIAAMTALVVSCLKSSYLK